MQNEAYGEEAETLLRIFKEVLNIEDVAVDIPFQELNITSILVATIILRIQEIFQVAIDVEPFFNPATSNIKALSELIAKKRSAGSVFANQNSPEGNNADNKKTVLL